MIRRGFLGVTMVLLVPFAVVLNLTIGLVVTAMIRLRELSDED